MKLSIQKSVGKFFRAIRPSKWTFDPIASLTNSSQSVNNTADIIQLGVIDAVAASTSIASNSSSILDVSQTLPLDLSSNELTANPTQSLPPPATSCTTCSHKRSSRYKNPRCKLLTRLLIVVIITAFASMGSTLLNRALSSVQGSDAGSTMNTGLEIEGVPVVLESTAASNLTTTEEFDPPGQEDLKRR